MLDRLSPRARAGLLAGTALAVVGWLFRGLLAGEVILQADLVQLFEPLRQASKAAFESGQLAWTDRMGGSGALLGNPLHGIAYPPNWLCLVVEPAVALSWLCALHLCFGALGTWLLARERGARPSGAWLAAAAFSLCGIGLSAALIPNLGWPLAWLPWLLLSHGRIRRRRGSWRPVVTTALVLAVLVVLAEPTLLFAGLLWIALAELRPLLRSRARRLPWRTLAATLLGLALALPALLPVLRTVDESVRAAGFQKEGMLQWSMHPAEPLGWLLPELFGDPELYGLEGHWALRLWPKRDNGLYHGAYWGLPLLSLALVGASLRGRRRFELVAWSSLLLLLALGRHGPIFPWLAELPMSDAWRYPAKWLTPLSLPVALLAARGLEALRRRRLPLRLLVPWALLASVAVAVMLSEDRLWDLLGPPGSGAPDWWREHLLAAGLTALGPASAFGLLAVLGRRGRLATEPLLAACITLELLLVNASLVPTVPLATLRRPPAAIRSLQGEPVQRLWVDPAPRLRWSLPPATRAQYHRWERESLRLSTGASFGLPQAFPVDFEAMSPLHHALLERLIATAPEREQLMLLGAAGVSHVARFDRYRSGLAELFARHEVGTQRSLLLYRNRIALPRARVVEELVPYSAFEDIHRVLVAAPVELFARAALVAEADRPPAAAGTGSTAELVADTGDRLVIRCRGGGGYLILSDPFTAGWTATIDGEPAAMFRADVAFRGLVLPPGEHEIVMSYSRWLPLSP